MNALKSAAASAKEKVENVGSKAELKKEEKKIEGEKKVGKAMANDKEQKQEVKADAHAKHAEAIQGKKEASATHEAEKLEIKQDLDARKTAAKTAAKEAYENPAV